MHASETSATLGALPLSDAITLASSLPFMVWFYQRDRLSLRLEARYDNEANEYVAILHYADGPKETQRLDTARLAAPTLAVLN